MSDLEGLSISEDFDMSEESMQTIPHPAVPIREFGDRLGFTYFPHPKAPSANVLNAFDTDKFWITVDDQLVYSSFFKDTGPLHVGYFYRFCLHLHNLLEDDNMNGKRVVLYSSNLPDKKANAALLLSLYTLVVLRWSPADSLHPLSELEFQPFRDAGYARADFHLTLQDCVYGVKKAIDNRLLRLDCFDLKEYEYFEKVENGDWNWITPGIIAFASPLEKGYPHRRISDASKLPKAFINALEHFEKDGVKIVIRLNKRLYDAKHFLDRGIRHKEMYFDDGTNPTFEMCREFIDICKKTHAEKGVVAVHCKAGLGRTGTLIGAYLIYEYGFTACEAIGFMRVMRPGMCVGPQQQYLYENQHIWVKWSAQDAMSAGLRSSRTPSPPVGNRIPVTPSNSRVPGQPRKTPGKLKNECVAPEEPDDENDSVGVRPAARLTRSRVARPHPVNANVVQSERSNTPILEPEVKRSRASQNLSNLFDPGSTENSSERRYDLRSPPRIASPSRLPKRVAPSSRGEQPKPKRVVSKSSATGTAGGRRRTRKSVGKE